MQRFFCLMLLQGLFATPLLAQQVIYRQDTTHSAVLEQIPEYRFGTEGLQEYIAKHLRYPKPARKAGITGTVYVRFLVDSTGALGNFSVQNGIGGGCDEEAVRVLKATSPWLPGHRQGRPIANYCVVPVSFERKK